MPPPVKVVQLHPDRRAAIRARKRAATAACRERQRKGQAITQVTYDAAIIALLIALGEITEAEAADKKLVSKAITNTLRRALNAVLKRHLKERIV
jgi:hypothetical protein